MYTNVDNGIQSVSGKYLNPQFGPLYKLKGLEKKLKMIEFKKYLLIAILNSTPKVTRVLDSADDQSLFDLNNQTQLVSDQIKTRIQI